MTTVRLYSQGLNPFSEKVACALSIKDVDYLRLEVADADEIKRLNPESQLLPVLEVDGKRCSESPKIVRWIDSLYPEPSLFATDPGTRSRQENLAEWSDTSFAFYWNRWRAARDETRRVQASRSQGLLTRLHRRAGEKMGFEPNGEDTPSSAELEIVVDIGKRINDLVGFLGTRPYFFAEQPSVADIAVYGMLLIMRDGPMPGSAKLLEDRPSLVAHLERMLEHTYGRTRERASDADEEPAI